MSAPPKPSHETVLCHRCRTPLHNAVERWIGLCEACEEHGLDELEPRGEQDSRESDQDLVW